MKQAARSKYRVHGRQVAGIAGSNPVGGIACVSVVYCQVKVSATGWSLDQSSHTKCRVSECDLEASTMRKTSLSWHEKKNYKCWAERLVTLNKPRLVLLFRTIIQDVFMPHNLFNTYFNINTHKNTYRHPIWSLPFRFSRPKPVSAKFSAQQHRPNRNKPVGC
jgi:hypothetical protein